MKKTFFKVLSSAAATVLAVVGMSLGPATAVSAANSYALDNAGTGFDNYTSDYLTVTPDAANGTTTYTYDLEGLTLAINAKYAIVDGVVNDVDYVRGLDSPGNNLGPSDGLCKPESSLALTFKIADGCQADVKFTGCKRLGDSLGFCEGTSKNVNKTVAPDGTVEKEAAEASFSDLNPGDYCIWRADSNLRLGTLAITVKKASYKDGVVSFNAPAGGSVSVKNGTQDVASGSTVTGGTELTLTAAPDEGNVAEIYVDGQKQALDGNNSVSIIVNGDVTVEFKFFEKINPTPVTATTSLSYEPSNIIKSTENATAPFVFTIDGEVAIETSSSRLKFTKAKTYNENALIFTTGDLTGKTTVISGSWANDGTSARGLKLCSDATSAEPTVLGWVADAKATREFNVECALESNTTYYISNLGGGGGVYLYGLTITVKDSADPTLTTGTFGNNDGSGVVVVNNDAVYAIAKITADKINSSALTLNIGDKASSTSEVYTSVEDNGAAVYTAAEGEYVYAVKLTDVTSDAQVDNIKTFTVALS